MSSFAEIDTLKTVIWAANKNASFDSAISDYLLKLFKLSRFELEVLAKADLTPHSAW